MEGRRRGAAPLRLTSEVMRRQPAPGLETRSIAGRWASVCWDQPPSVLAGAKVWPARSPGCTSELPGCPGPCPDPSAQPPMGPAWASLRESPQRPSVHLPTRPHAAVRDPAAHLLSPLLLAAVLGVQMGKPRHGEAKGLISGSAAVGPGLESKSVTPKCPYRCS